MNVAATISATGAAAQSWEAIVIGAGPAGSIVARELARRGAATLLVERQAFPRAKVCGGCLNGLALAALKSLQLEQVLGAAQAAPTRQLMIHSRQRSVTLELPGGVAIQRAPFDAALARAAIEAGAAFLPETTATVAAGDPPGAACRTVALTQRDREMHRAHARLVIAADGLGHPSVRHMDAFQNCTKEAARLGLALSMEGPRDVYGVGTIHMAVAEGGYVGLVRTADGRLNVAAAVDSAALRAAASPAHFVNHILRNSCLPPLWDAGGAMCRGTLPLTRHSRRLAHERVILLGDAAGYVEPFTGEGMGWAMRSAAALAPIAMQLLNSWEAPRVQAWERGQRWEMARGQVACRIVSEVLRRPRLVHLALAALQKVPAAARPIVRRIHGADVSWETGAL
ncbi:MAG TPA: NAD(P)/FAD-dependent oxidoreductase [Pirellulales bacterium]|nr:NAD(P)/FAD-dependent oxidoreductase [Pirellulales bacterium]